jgi:predicted secreted protein
VIQTSDGGYAAAGYTNFSSGPIYHNAWLVKTDARGNVQWSRTYGGAGDDFYASAAPLVQTADGGYAAAFLRKASGGVSDYDFWLVRTDAFGVMMWNRTYGSLSFDYLNGMIMTREGGFALAGSNNGINDAFVVVTDDVGNVEWSKTYGGSNGDGFNNLLQTVDGFVMVGQTYSYGAGDMDVWLLKTDAAGNAQWNKTYGTGYGESAYSLIQTFDGGFAMAGDRHYGNSYAKDMWLIKTDALGNLQWDHAYGDENHEGASCVVQTNDGGYFLAGYKTTPYTSLHQVWLVRVDIAGNVLWDKLFGGPAFDGASDVIPTADGGYMVTCQTTSFGAGGLDAWLLKIDSAGNAVDDFKYGLAWTASTANSITLYRGTDDEYWNYVRVRVWKVKESP